jgi:translocation and assembly module TamB
VRRFDNAFLRTLAGGLPSIDTKLRPGTDGVLHFSNGRPDRPVIRMTGDGFRRRDGSFSVQGHRHPGAIRPGRMTLDGMIDHPAEDRPGA